MTPDVTKPQRLGLIAMGIGAVLLLALPWFVWDGGIAADAAAQADKARKLAAGEALAKRVEEERTATVALVARIDELKQRAGFTLHPAFLVPADEKQPGQFFNTRFVSVQEDLRIIAHQRGVGFKEWLGFPSDGKVASDAVAQDLLRMLQITEKAVRIALQAPEAIDWFEITHAKPDSTGPPNRPVLLREFPVTLKLRGSHSSLLWIIHRLSQIDPDEPGKVHDYPLILRGCTIKSPITNEKDVAKLTDKTLKDEVIQLDCTLELAAMEFLSDRERGAAPPAAKTASTVITARP